jgi:hypothetical protein
MYVWFTLYESIISMQSIFFMIMIMIIILLRYENNVCNLLLTGGRLSC